MLHYVLSRIRRNLLRYIEIDRNRRSEELRKLVGGQKIFIFRKACPMSGAGREGNSLGEGSYPSAYYDIFLATYKSLRFVTFLSISLLNNANRL